MNINNFYWWLLILLNFASYFTYGLGNISRGNSRLLIEFVGGTFFILSFIAMSIFFGLWSGVILIAIAFVLVSPIVGLLMAHIEKKLYKQQHEVEAKVEVKKAQELNMSPDELKKYKNMDDNQIVGMLEQMLPGITKEGAQKRSYHIQYISFFHHSDNYIEEFRPQDEVRPSFYWFGDRYYNHYNTTTRFKYFYLFVKNPKKDEVRFRERYEGGFNSLYSRYLKYKKERDQKIQKGVNDWSSPEPAILLSFSKITPDLILEFEDQSSNNAVVIKPQDYRGQKISLFDTNDIPIQFIDIPEIVKILPHIKQSFPFVEPKKDKDEYVYEDWLPMVTEQRSKNLLRALNEGAMKNRKTY